MPIVRVLEPRVTFELAAPVRDATDWLAPRTSVELPVPVVSIEVAVRPLAVGRALVTFAVSVPPSMMRVGPL